MDDENISSFAEEQPWLKWVAYIVAASISFWFQAIVTEERFVPALNIVALWLEIPDDVAGATLMAGGASTPELFGSYVALFITHSALGIGTIVGSGIFNQLVITAGAVFAARGKSLQLDPLILLREAGFYGLAIVFLLYALSKKEIDDDNDDDEPLIIISVFEGALLLFGYLLYVIVCAKFDAIVYAFRKLSLFPARLELLAQEMCYITDYRKRQFSKMTSLTKINVPELPFLRYVEHEPRDNFKMESNITGAHTSQKEGNFFMYELDESKPNDLNDVETLEINESDGSFSCFLWQQSFFYNKARIDLNAWQLRWFTFTANGIESKLSKTASKQDHSFKYLSISNVEVDEDHLLIRLHRTKSHRRPYILMAANAEILFKTVEMCDRMLTLVSVNVETNLDGQPTDPKEVKSVEHEMTDEHHHNLIKYSEKASIIRKILFLLLFPFNAVIHFTIPDIRSDGVISGNLPLKKAFFAIFICITWLIVSSYILVESLEEIGRLMNIPHAIIGITISAAGTSVANFVASQCAAKQGLGNMAVSNAFGSNSFIIFVGLGLPWLTYCITEQEGEPYVKLQDEGLSESVVLMAIVLVLFMILMWWNNFVLRRIHAYIFILGYVLYIVIAIGQNVFFEH